MANLKEIRTRITSVNSIKKITSAMKMVAAAKLRKAQSAIIQMRPYAEKLHDIIDHVMSSTKSVEDNIYQNQRKVERVLVIIIASNKGLCGAFNSNAVKKADDLVQEDYSELFKKGLVDIYTIGKKANNLLRSRKITVKNSFEEIYNDLNFNAVSELAQKIMDQFTGKEYDRVHIVYNQFKNVAIQKLTVEQFLPVSLENDEDKVPDDYIFEPNKEQIIEQLVPYALKIQLYKAILDSNASEQGARMTAMHKATDNATEILKELKLTYNKVRQASITSEILEIVGGAEALKS